MAARLFRIKSNRPGATGVEITDTSNGLQWMSGGPKAAVFGVPRIEANLSDADPLDEFDIMTKTAQPRRFPIELQSAGTAQEIADTQGALIQEISDCNRYGGTMRYRPEGMDYPVNLELIDISLGDNEGLWSHGAETFGHHSAMLDVTAQPWARTDPMSVEDYFTTDTLAATGGRYNDGGADWTAIISNQLLSYHQRSLELGVSIGTDGWSAGTNCSITSSTTQASSGTRSLRLSSTAGGTMTATTNTTTRMAVLAGEAYAISVKSRAGSAARTVTATLYFYDASGSLLGNIATTPAVNATGSWTSYTASGTSPANSAYAHLEVSVASTGGAAELHYFDEMSVTATNANDISEVASIDTTVDRMVFTGKHCVETMLLHTGSRWTFADPLVEFVVHPDEYTTQTMFGAVLKYVDSSNYVGVQITPYVAGSRWFATLVSVIAGVETRTAIGDIGSEPLANSRSKFVIMMNDTRISVGLADIPADERTYPGNVENAQITTALTTAQAAVFGKGVRGRVAFWFNPGRVTANVSWVRAYDGTLTYATGAPLASNHRLSAALPTSASPTFELQTGRGAEGLNTDAWMGFGWWNRPRPLNHISQRAWSASCWAVAAVTGIQANAGTNITAGSNAPADAAIASSLRIAVAGATSGAGANYRDMGRTYQYGKTYVVKVRHRRISGSGNVSLVVGRNGSTQTTTLTQATAWTTTTWEFTMNENVTNLYFSFQTASAAAQTWDIAGFQVWEKDEAGLIPPERSGGYLPYGWIPAVGTIVASPGTISTNGSSDTGLTVTRSGTGQIYVRLPVTNEPIDEIGEQSIVDLYAIIWQPSTISSANIIARTFDLMAGGNYIYAEPYGSGGKQVLTNPSSGTARRFHYIGRLAIPRSNEQSYIDLDVNVVGTGTFEVEGVVGFPVESSIMTPTGVVQASLAGDIMNKIVKPNLEVISHIGEPAPGRLLGAPLRLEGEQRIEACMLTGTGFIPDSTTSSTGNNNGLITPKAGVAMVVTPRVYLNESVE